MVQLKEGWAINHAGSRSSTGWAKLTKTFSNLGLADQDLTVQWLRLLTLISADGV